jgi:hypothetical protein
MQTPDAAAAYRAYDLQQLFEPAPDSAFQQLLQSETFSRTRHELGAGATLLLDIFPEIEGASCLFLRLEEDEALTLRFTAQGEYRMIACPSGGWMLKPTQADRPSYWIPQAPLMRSYDTAGRILSEKPTTMVGFEATSTSVSIELQTIGDMHLDLTVWRFAPEAASVATELERPLTLESQPVFFWTSQTVFQEPADVYLYLIHGQVYTNRFIWPRKWKICSEHDAYGLYVLMTGLALATEKTLYTLLKQQLLFSVVARQSDDGGWYHGEWTDLVESHYRFHNGATLLLEAALEERHDVVVYAALQGAASFTSRHIDTTDLGLWFLHDSLEESEEGMNALWEQTGAPWRPTRTLGKAATNKLILNTHIDSTVALQRYRQVTDDEQYSEQVDSARAATLAMLSLRPAEPLYRLVYWALGLTLLPEAEARQLPLPVRMIKRLTWQRLIPQLHRIKRMFPRFVMPGGLIERHLSPPHWGVTYHPVNIMDLARLWRCFPQEDLEGVITRAIGFVANSSFVKYCAEAKPRQYALVVYADALYQLYTMNPAPEYRRHLAEAMLYIGDTGLGLPPCLIGADPEATEHAKRIPCPSPADARLRIANLSHNGRMEVLVVNNSSDAVELVWEGDRRYPLTWSPADNEPVANDGSAVLVPARGWLWGRQEQ